MKNNYNNIELKQADEIIDRAMYDKNTIDATIYTKEILDDLEFRQWIKCHRHQKKGHPYTLTKDLSLDGKLSKGKFSDQYNSRTLGR